MGIHWTCCQCEQQVEDHQYELDERMCYDCLDAGNYHEPTKHDKVSSGNNEKPQLILMAWHKYCMESPIFRMFVKLGWRK